MFNIETNQGANFYIKTNTNITQIQWKRGDKLILKQGDRYAIYIFTSTSFELVSASNGESGSSGSSGAGGGGTGFGGGTYGGGSGCVGNCEIPPGEVTITDK